MIISADTIIGGHFGHFEELYHKFHEHPELSHKEEKTAAVIAGELKAMEFQVIERVGGHGVIGILKNGPGKTTLIRTDMDALPIREETDAPYKSQVPGVMHACGHDVHMTSFLGTAHVLAKVKNKWSGTLVAIAQPAEEVGEGAMKMIDDGLFKKIPRPDHALAMHVGGSTPAGTINYSNGYALANVDYVDMTVYGRGGHGAKPHTTVDPIVISARIVSALQSLVSRELSPHDAAVVTVGSIHGGSSYNVIPEEVKLQLTVRSSGDRTRAHLKAGIHRIAQCLAESASAPRPKIDYREGVPALYNDPSLVARLLPVFEEIVGKENLKEIEMEMYGEDFAYYGYKTGIPIFIFWVGAAVEKGANAPMMHSPRFLPDFKGAFMTGVSAMVNAVITLQK